MFTVKNLTLFLSILNDYLRYSKFLMNDKVMQRIHNYTIVVSKQCVNYIGHKIQQCEYVIFKFNMMVVHVFYNTSWGNHSKT